MELILFADDTNILMSDKCLTNLNDKINSELRKVSIWFKLNKLSLNVKKTNFVIFTNNKFKKLSQPFKVNIDGINVEQVTEAKFLGIIVTENLSWDSHIKTIKI